jgi:tetratricopeptide (TPR) repeat protein
VASLGAVLLAQRRAGEALAVLAPAADTLARVLGPGHDAALLVRINQALALVLLGRLDEAGALLVANQVSLAGANVASATRARASVAQAMLARLRGQPAAAIEGLRAILANAEGDAAPKLQRERMRAHIEAGLAHLALARPAEAAAAFEAALRDIERLETAPTPAQAEASAGLSQARRARRALSQQQAP